MTLHQAIDVISEHTGVQMFVYSGGPCPEDPAGLVHCGITFKDQHRNAIALKVDSEHRLSHLGDTLGKRA